MDPGYCAAGDKPHTPPPTQKAAVATGTNLCGIHLRAATREGRHTTAGCLNTQTLKDP